MASQEEIALMAHLLRRAGFGASRADIEAKAVVGSAGMMKPEEGKYRAVRYARSPRRYFVDFGACPVPPCFPDQPRS